MAADFLHQYLPGNKPVTLLALHGVGGDENDFVHICRVIVPGAAILSPRLAPDTSADSLAEWLKGYGRSPLFAFAYGEGADLAARILLNHPGPIAGGVLLRPNGIARPETLPALGNAPILIAAEPGREDLARLLSEAGAAVDLALSETGPHLGPQDFAIAKSWFTQILS